MCGLMQRGYPVGDDHVPWAMKSHELGRVLFFVGDKVFSRRQTGLDSVCFHAYRNLGVWWKGGSGDGLGCGR